MDCISLLGGCYLGLGLPQFIVDNKQSKIWEIPAGGAVGDAAPNSKNGHAVAIFGYDSRYLYFVTWGSRRQMSWQFFDTYMDEAHGIVSSDFVNPLKRSNHRIIPCIQWRRVWSVPSDFNELRYLAEMAWKRSLVRRRSNCLHSM